MTDQGDKNTSPQRDFFGSDGVYLKGYGVRLASGTSGEAQGILGRQKLEKFSAKKWRRDRMIYHIVILSKNIML